jgi:hypothetical protein
VVAWFHTSGVCLFARVVPSPCTIRVVALCFGVRTAPWLAVCVFFRCHHQASKPQLVSDLMKGLYAADADQTEMKSNFEANNTAKDW